MPSKDLIFNIIGVDRASKTFENVSRKAETTGSKLTKFGVVGAAGVAAVGVAVGLLAKKCVDKFEEAANATLGMQRILGGTAEAASRLNFAAEETGVTQDKLGVGIKTLSTHLAANDKAWKLTGLSVKDAHGNLLTTTAALPKLADIFAKMPAGAQKTALAVKLFGKSGVALLPLLNKGSSGLKSLSEESDKLGHTLSGPQVAAVHKVALAHREFSAAVSGVEIQIGAALYPALAKIIPQVSAFAASFAEKAIPVIKEFGKWFAGSLLPALEQAWQQIMPGVGRAFESVGKMLSGGKGGWKGVGDAIIGFIGVASKVIGFVLPVMIRLWGVQLHTYQLVYKAIVAFGSIARTIFADVVGVFLAMVGAVIDGAAKAFGWVPGIGGKLKAAARHFDDFRDSVNNALNGVHKSITIDFHSKMDAGILAALRAGGQAGARAAQGVHGRTAFASGTNYAPGGLALVGEMGPELVNLPRGSQVKTASQTAPLLRGRSVTNIVNIHVSGVVGDKRATGKEIALALQAWQESTRRPLPFKTA